MKNSPTPWTLVEHSWAESSIYDKNDKVVAKLSIYDEATEDTQEKLEAQMDADARLIRAAPEMFNILRGISEVLEPEKDFTKKLIKFLEGIERRR